MYKLTFYPFVGKSYNNNNIFNGKKIAVLGESHYGSITSTDITRDVLNRYLDPNIEREGWMSTFLKFERSLVNKETTREESQVIWNSLIFYNYVQVLLDGPREAATKQQYRDSEEAFFQVLEEHQPDVLIVWGRRLWTNLPYSNWEEGEVVRIDGFTVDNGTYTLSTGHKVKAFCVYHPSSGYDWSRWHTVISKFIYSEDKATNVIDGVGFSNFKRFNHFPSLNLGGVNIIVGANNAGKSTFDKATVLFLDFIKKWLAGTCGFRIDFSSQLCQDLGINSFEDAFNYNANKNRDELIFKMTVGRYYYEAGFSPFDVEAEENTIATTTYVKVVDTEDNDSEYVFHYDLSQNSSVVNVLFNTYSPATDGIEVIEHYLNSPRCPIDEEEKDNVRHNLDIIKEYIENTSFNNPVILDAFKQVKDIIGANVPNDYDLFEALCSAMKQVVANSEGISLEITLPRTTTLRDLFGRIRRINDVQAQYDESRRNNPLVIETKTCPIITLSHKKTFSIYDTDSVSLAVSGFGLRWKQNFINGYYYLVSEGNTKDEGASFLEKWLKEFEIGTNLRYRTLSNEVYEMNILTMDSHWVSLTSMGMGTVHLVALLLTIIKFIMDNGKLTKQVLILEEPGINLHPNRQSMLADLLMDIYNTFGVQIIVETHSEYLVRKIQVIVANLFYNGEAEPEELNKKIKIFCFPPNSNPYPLEFENDGYLSRDFLPGFYDEACELHWLLNHMD